MVEALKTSFAATGGRAGHAAGVAWVALFRAVAEQRIIAKHSGIGRIGAIVEDASVGGAHQSIVALLIGETADASVGGLVAMRLGGVQDGTINRCSGLAGIVDAGLLAVAVQAVAALHVVFALDAAIQGLTTELDQVALDRSPVFAEPGGGVAGFLTIAEQAVLAVKVVEALNAFAGGGVAAQLRGGGAVAVLKAFGAVIEGFVADLAAAVDRLNDDVAGSAFVAAGTGSRDVAGAEASGADRSAQAGELAQVTGFVADFAAVTKQAVRTGAGGIQARPRRSGVEANVHRAEHAIIALRIERALSDCRRGNEQAQ